MNRHPIPWPALLALALLYTGLNAAKPLTIDDTAYYYVAAQAARDPLDPYGFTVHWYHRPQPALHLLAPPVLPYWWSLAIRLFGDQPVLWKLWLLPFSLLFVVTLYALLRRFAPGVEIPLLWPLVLSPAFLPSLNLMLDVPALALGLAALVVFIRATDVGPGRPRLEFGLAALAGLLAGLAVQTKYTAAVVPAVLLLHGLLRRRLSLALVPVGVAVAVFLGWEAFLTQRYGESHFLYQLRQTGRGLTAKLLLVPALLLILGGIGGPLALTALTALGARRWLVAVAGALGVAVLVVLGLVQGRVRLEGLTVPWIAASGQLPDVGVALHPLLYGLTGLAFGLILLAALARLARGAGGWSFPPRLWLNHRTEAFLLGWLALELAGYLALTPFPAVRRLLGLMVVLTLLVGRLATVTCRTPERRLLLRGVGVFGILLGLTFYVVDWHDARAEQEAVRVAAELVADQAPSSPPGETWFVGHWGFQFYAERAGMKSVAPDRSQLHQGDWLVVPDDNVHQQEIDIANAPLRRVARLVVDDRVPWRTVMDYYGGTAPLTAHIGPRLTVTVYRATADFVPATDW